MVHNPVNPFKEIHLLTLHSTRGFNYWARRPVTRVDLSIGAYEDISSAQAPGCVEQLLAAMPTLMDHHCSVGTPGGFAQRLRTGTYVAHIVEHVAIELQCLMGDIVGFGQTRGTGNPGYYTVVFEHRHETVGLRAAVFALEIVQHAFAGTLLTAAFGQDRVPMIARMIAELRAIRATPDSAPVSGDVHIGITGGNGRSALCDRLAHAEPNTKIVDVSPSYILHAGLPYAHSDAAIILDADLTDVPARFREPERAARLVSVVADAVPPEGAVICPTTLSLVLERLRSSDVEVVTFPPSANIAEHVRRAAEALRRWQSQETLVPSQ